MGRFFIHSLSSGKVIEYVHDLGNFQFFIGKDSKNPKQLIFSSRPKLTEALMKSVSNEAILQIKKFGVRFGYEHQNDLSFDEIIDILNKAQEYAKKLA